MEIVLPCFLFGGKKLRRIAFFGIALLQLLLILTGNFAFLNFLALALAFILLDDRCFVPFSGLFPGLREGNLLRPVRHIPTTEGRRLLTYGLGGALFLWSLVLSLGQVADVEALPGPLGWVDTWTTPWHSVNAYHLFPVMTKSRGEIEIEGSLDGVRWKPYRFRYKPDLPPGARPAWIAPFQPRLDWQMWFAALSTGDKTPWFANLLARLLQGSPDVTGLFASAPFGSTPPHYIRALLYDYRFTTPQERAASPGHAQVWKRTPVGWYSPPTTLNAPATSNP